MLCHHYGCIFVHIPKAAGQSIEQAFLATLGLSWETRAPLLLRSNDNALLGPRALAHLTAQEYVDLKYMTQEQFNNYFKFAFVRDPYTRLVSTYIYFDYIKEYNFRAFVQKVVSNKIQERDTRHFLPQTEYLCTGEGKLLVDFIGRFENLQKDFDHVCDSINMPRVTLAHANKTISEKAIHSPMGHVKNKIRTALSWKTERRLKSNYMEYYDDESLELVNRLYALDFKQLGYEMLSEVR